MCGAEVAVLWCLGCDAGGCANPLVNVRVLLHWGLDHVQAENFASSLQMICEFLHYENFESAGFSVQDSYERKEVILLGI